jgi:glutamine amidotransferase
MRALRIDIIDYGMGNLQSVQNALERFGCEVEISSDPATIDNADALILPGVGAFGEAMTNLRQKHFVDPIKRAVLNDRKPMLGICLGMQLLAEDSDERGMNDGLGLIPGHVRRIQPPDGFRLPHIGWNALRVVQPEPLFHDFQDGDAFYFVHSYAFDADPQYVAATTDYGLDVVAAVQRDRIFGVQFHPERSQRKGLRLLRNFLDVVSSTIPETAAAC